LLNSHVFITPVPLVHFTLYVISKSSLIDYCFTNF
jgi:hypothetical protein